MGSAHLRFSKFLILNFLIFLRYLDFLFVDVSSSRLASNFAR